MPKQIAENYLCRKQPREFGLRFLGCLRIECAGLPSAYSSIRKCMKILPAEGRQIDRVYVDADYARLPCEQQNH